VLGTMLLVANSTEDELVLARQRTWHERSSESRQSFTWPEAGQALATSEHFSKAVPELPPANFALLILAPERVDTLDLAQAPHARTIHTLEQGDWRTEAVNP
jgi:pyridoxamine 5'-phosphate oxidase